MKRPAILALALLISSVSNAEIYRWVDQDGHVNYSDHWAPSSQRLKQTAVPQTEPKQVPRATPVTDDELFLGPYSALDIVSPVANETLTQESNSLPVSLLIDPPLIEGQQLSLILDGVPLTTKNAGTQFKLTGIAFGSHQLQLRVLGADGRTVAQTPPRNFHLIQPKQPGQLQ